RSPRSTRSRCCRPYRPIPARGPYSRRWVGSFVAFGSRGGLPQSRPPHCPRSHSCAPEAYVAPPGAYSPPARDEEFGLWFLRLKPPVAEAASPDRGPEGLWRLPELGS